MSLKGSLEDFALPEVLQLLADTSKTGKLQISGHGCANGSLWFRSGSIVAFDVSASQQPSEAIFEMLRVGRGYFDFQAEGVAPASAKIAADDRQDVRGEIARARAQLAEWDTIVSVVPSLDHRVNLVNALKDDTVTIGRDQWAIVAAISGGQKVSRILSDRYLGEYEGCKAIKDLVDAGLVGVTDSEGTPVVSSPVAVYSRPASPPVPERVEPEVAVAAEVEADPEPAIEAVVEPVPAEVAQPEPEPVFEPEPVVSVEPEPVAQPEPEPVFEPEPVVSVEPEPTAPPERVSPLLAFGLPTTVQSTPVASAPGSFDDDGDYVYRPPVVEPPVAPEAEAVAPATSTADATFDDAPAYSAPAEAIWAKVDNEYTGSPDAGWTQADDGYAEPATDGSVAPAVEAAPSNQDQFAELRAAIAKAEAEELAAAAAAMGEAVAGSAPSPAVTHVEVEQPAPVSDYYAAPAPEDDGRSALRALLAEVTSHAEPTPAAGPDDTVTESYAPAVAYDAPDDALVDRGPWTSRELASLEQMEGWRDDEVPAAHTPEYAAPAPEYADPAEDAGGTILPFRGVSAWSGEPDPVATPAPAAEEPAPAHAEHDGAAVGEEPINRGLLLKFLSSVRN